MKERKKISIYYLTKTDITKIIGNTTNEKQKEKSVMVNLNDVY